MAQQHFFIVCVLVFMFVVSASSETNSTTLQNGKEILILKMDIFMALYKICYTHTIKVCYEAETDAKKCATLLNASTSVLFKSLKMQKFAVFYLGAFFYLNTSKSLSKLVLVVKNII